MIYRGLKPHAPKKDIESLSYIRQMLRSQTSPSDLDVKKYKLYGEYLQNLRTHEDLLRRYKLISNTHQEENVNKTAAMVGLRTVKPFEQDPASHFDKFRDELKNVFQ